MRFLRVLFAALLLIVLVVFAVSNRQAVTVSLEPLPFILDLPLYLLVFLVFLAGLVFGAILGRLNAWTAARRKRQRDAQKAAAHQATGPAEQPAGTLPSVPPPAV
ncbi:MAG: lipopolysaccharide assembly protein LapA domain-containing protein [Ferrovibrio sp.]|uniref:lipopolysaccharide assembly protein LapA domain-containing protein n=1 Tax=Ferrovibrio sp. TaxID=1917215 RepID=UPI00391E0519